MLDRIKSLRRQLNSKGLDSILISYPINLKYISGFTGSTGWIIITQNSAILAVDFRYVEQAKTEAPDFEISHIRGNPNEWLPPLLNRLGVIKLGIEIDHTSVSQYQMLMQCLREKAPWIEIVQTANVIESLRLYKDNEELHSISKACDIVDLAVAFIRSHIRTGITEKQFAWELESHIRQNNSDTLPFDIIVASGPNAALPHARPSEKIISEGEPIIIDMGARYQGYCSDITRTFIIGKEDNTFNNIYNIVLSAQTAGLSMIKPEMECSFVDKLVRSMIINAGYGDYFGHGLGHGIGLETHEAPGLGANSTYILQEGMVFTIEPGIYIPGWGGVRIEDTVTIKDGKIICLTKSDKNFLISGGKMP